MPTLPEHRKLSGVPFTDVQLDDAFWAPRLKICREKSIPHNFEWCENTGRFSNFAKAGGLIEGKFEGIYFNDSDVYKVLEGASYSLADHPDPKLDEMVDDVIAKIAAAQQENGYLNSYYTLVEPDKKWTNCRVRHELYCAGHLFEAAVAHYRATGKKTLLDVAEKFAARIGEIFGPGKRTDVPGHEEIELALVKLYELTGKEQYLELSKFFLDARGNEENRPKIYGPYLQDHKPVREQDEVVGHAVRAMYLYSGVADVAAHTGDEGFMKVMDRIWDDVVNHKMYITGGIGARHQGESFGDRYELPNGSAYAETCAAIGLGLWSHRMNLLHADAAYADVLERVLYNGFLSGVGLSGKKFFYVNPLQSSGGHHRQPFYPCACCPTNVIRVLPSLPGYLYAVDGDRLFVNLYVQSDAKVKLDGDAVSLAQETNYPWDGKVKLTVSPQKAKEFTLNLRIPDWCDDATVAVNGKSVSAKPNDRGYVTIARTWKAGDVVELDLPMEIKRIEANPRVEADRGRVAVRRGPVVYCFEGVDNDVNVATIVLGKDPEFTAEMRDDLLGRVVVIRGKDRKGRTVTAVPYYSWDNREPGPMAVWVRQDGMARNPKIDDPSWEGKLYRPLDPATLGPSEPLTAMELTVPSASHCHSADSPAALIDGLEPKDSCDHSIPRFTWWSHRGTKEWVGYDFDEAMDVSKVDVYWFDDEQRKGACRVPKSWKLLYRDGGKWKPVANASGYGTEKDKYNTTTFKPVKTDALRMEVQLQKPWSGGILEWRVGR